MPFCYLTTTGRVTGRPHEIEIWFAVDGGRIYLLAGGGTRSDWVRNLVRNPRVVVRVGHRRFDAAARVVNDDDGRARRLLAAKYQGWREGSPLSEWTATATLVEVTPAG